MCDMSDEDYSDILKSLDPKELVPLNGSSNNIARETITVPQSPYTLTPLQPVQNQNFQNDPPMSLSKYYETQAPTLTEPYTPQTLPAFPQTFTTKQTYTEPLEGEIADIDVINYHKQSQQTEPGPSQYMTTQFDTYIETVYETEDQHTENRQVDVEDQHTENIEIDVEEEPQTIVTDTAACRSVFYSEQPNISKKRQREEKETEISHKRARIQKTCNTKETTNTEITCDATKTSTNTDINYILIQKKTLFLI